MKIVLQFISLCFFLFIMASDLIAAPLMPLGPFDITGTIRDIQWAPEKKVKGIPGMSGSAGRDRVIQAHFLITLTDFEGVGSETAIAMTRYLDWSSTKDVRKDEKPSSLLLKLNHSDKEYLKRGMNIKVIGYTVRGDEGGTWTSYKNIEIRGRAFQEENIRDYLQKHIESPNFGGRTFCSYELFGSEKKRSRQYIYMWALCMEYYVKDGILMQGAGSSMPLALIAVHSRIGEKIINHQKPVDGEGYGESIRKIFPKKYHNAIFSEPKEYNRRAENLLSDTERQAKVYYHLK